METAIAPRIRAMDVAGGVKVSTKAHPETWLRFIRSRFIPKFWDGIRSRVWATVTALVTAVLILIAQFHYGVITSAIRPRVLSLLWPYGLLLLAYVLFHLARAPWLISNDHLVELVRYAETINELKLAARRKDHEIRALAQPRRTAAEQHAYEVVKAVLEMTKETGLIALRHLRYQGKLTFGTYDPQLPPGLNRDRTLWVYNHCVSVGVVNRTNNLGNSEATYSVSQNPDIAKALDELLFPDK